MSNYCETDFCSQQEGLDYIFSRMMAIYGASFARHFDGIDPDLVRDEWINQIGIYLTYRPSMDYAIEHLEDTFIPSAIKFKNLCNAGPRIPLKPERTLEYRAAQSMTDEGQKKGMELLAELRKKIKGQL
jgi:hypothetical protein